MLVVFATLIAAHADSTSSEPSELGKFLDSVTTQYIRSLPKSDSIRHLSIGSLLVTWADGADPAQSRSDFSRLLGTEPMAFRHYLDFCTYGRLDTSGSFVSGWHKLKKSKRDLTDPSKAPDCEAITRQAVADVDGKVDLRRAQSLLVFTSDKASDTNSGAAGSSTFSVNGNSKKLGFAVVGDYSFTLQVAVHEFGHVMGLNHTRGSAGGTSWFTGMCSQNSFGLPNRDPFFGFLPITYGAPERLRLGAFEESQVELISDENPHTVLLSDLNGRPTSDKQVIIIPLEKSSHYFTVESRFFGRVYDRPGDLPGEGVVVNEVNLNHDEFVSMPNVSKAELKREYVETVIVSRSSQPDTKIGTWLTAGEELHLPSLDIKCSRRVGSAFEVKITRAH